MMFSFLVPVELKIDLYYNVLYYTVDHLGLALDTVKCSLDVMKMQKLVICKNSFMNYK